MQFTFLIFSLIGVLTGTSFRAKALIFASAVTFVATLGTAVAAGSSVLAAIGAAFALVFTLQIFYLIGVILVYGTAEIARRFKALVEPRQRSLRRISKPAP